MSRLSEFALYTALTGAAVYIGVIGTGLVQGLVRDAPAKIVSAEVPAAMSGMSGMAGMDGMSGMNGMAEMAAQTGMSGMAGMAPEAAAAPVDVVSAGPDAAAGEKVFAKCKACHTADDKMKNGVGPSLWGVLNRPVASIEGFKYSEAMKGHGGNWDAATLDGYLENPKTSIPGNKMAFVGLKDASERMNVIAFLAGKSATPVDPSTLGLAAAAPTAAGEANAPEPDTASAEAPASEIAQIPHVDLPAPSAEQQAKENDAIAALEAAVKGLDYQRARYHPIHFKGNIESATNGECLVCHSEVLGTNVRDASPAGLKNDASIAWYQTLATYDGTQQTFHQRHMTTPYAQAVMKLDCNFCHKGNDPREEAPDMQPNINVFPASAETNFTLRKMVNPSETCLLCHGAMPDPVNIMGLAGPWHEARVDLETAETPNGCLTCHGELFRTNRHNVNYLNAATIEDLATESSDVCFGCHGGRSWYRISYPYPRHPWPGMDPAVPEWAANRPAESKPEHQLPTTAQ